MGEADWDRSAVESDGEERNGRRRGAKSSSADGPRRRWSVWMWSSAAGAAWFGRATLRFLVEGVMKVGCPEPVAAPGKERWYGVLPTAAMDDGADDAAVTFPALICVSCPIRHPRYCGPPLTMKASTRTATQCSTTDVILSTDVTRASSLVPAQSRHDAVCGERRSNCFFLKLLFRLGRTRMPLSAS